MASHPIYQFYVELDDYKPKIWRRFQVINNVFCANCSLTTIVDYALKNDKYGVVLEGKCEKCGGPVGRLVEDC